MEETKMDWLTKCYMHMTKEKCDVRKWSVISVKCGSEVWCVEMSIRPIYRPEKGMEIEKGRHPYSSNNLILLSKQHHLASLITEYAHEKTVHDGVNKMLTELWSKYWFVRGWQFVRKIIHMSQG